ncbi:MAG: hypothetical protein LR015_03860 [Verrucomicrobia bacterium]|nr:hypothetical protein [Verrucomicrobiota bacterium]
MSNSTGSHDPEPSDNKVLLSAVGWLGVILLFGLVVAVAYLPNRAQSIEARQAEQRHAIRASVVAEQQRIANSYDWVNRDQGVVRIPIDRAMQLTLRDLRIQQASSGIEVLEEDGY